MVIDKAGCGFKGYASISKGYNEAGNVMANLGIITCFDNLKKEAPESFLFVRLSINLILLRSSRMPSP